MDNRELGTVRPALLRESFSAGGVACRTPEEGPAEVALIRLRGQAYWTLPKGILEGDETPERTALREVREETGLSCSIRCPLGSVAYWYEDKQENLKIRKTVHYFLMDVNTGSLDQHDNEVDEAAFFPVPDAPGILKFRNDRQMMEKAMSALKETGHGA